MPQLVSILIPAYNSQSWIGDCIESACRQDWPRKEVIVVDDGSSDATYQEALRFSSPEVRIEKQPNGGACAARNRALSLASGDYVQWLDADDLLAPDKISRQMADAGPGKNSDVLFSGPWGKFHRHPEMARFVPDRLWQDMAPVEWLYRKLEYNLWMPPAAFLVSRKLVESAGLWDETLYRDNDGEYFSRVLSAASRVHFVPGARAFKRTTFGISSNITLSDKKLTSLCTALLGYTERLLAMEDSERTRGACLKLLSRWSIYFYPERADLYQKIQQRANDLGGHVSAPRLRMKYRAIQHLLGWRTAKRIQRLAPIVRMYVDSKKEQRAYRRRKRRLSA